MTEVVAAQCKKKKGLENTKATGQLIVTAAPCPKLTPGRPLRPSLNMPLFLQPSIQIFVPSRVQRGFLRRLEDAPVGRIRQSDALPEVTAGTR